MRYIQEMREGDRVSGIYLCKKKMSGTKKNGGTYYSVLLQDKTGILDGKIWDLNNNINNFEASDFIHVDGDVKEYNGALQMSIQRVRVAEEGEYDVSDYCPVSPYPIEEMYRELLGYVKSIQSNPLHMLAESFFVDDKEFIRLFRAHSAAKTMHHGFMGGLLQHTLGVTRICDSYCKLYPRLDRDLLITAALFHDIGKVRELSDFPDNDYTDEGQLLGHIVIGSEMIAERIRTIPGFPPALASQLRHCVLSHHGELEYGSPKKPAIAEAIALNFADNADAKFEMMFEALDENKACEGEWIGFNKGIDSNIRKTTKN